MQEFTLARDEYTMDEIWLMQHLPVFTLGRNALPEHLLAPGDIPVVQVDRGGQVTYHGPGQLIAYLLVDLRRRGLGVRQMVSAMERAVVGMLAEYGLQSYADPKAPGVYINGEKIAALGLRVKQHRSYHGLSVNVDMDLAPFNRINPCGYQGLRVTQLKESLPQIQWGEVEERLLERLLLELDYNSVVAVAE